MNQRYEFGDFTLIVGDRPKRHRGAYLRGTRCWTVVGRGHERRRRPTIAFGWLNSARGRLVPVSGPHAELPADLIAKLSGLAGLA